MVQPHAMLRRRPSQKMWLPSAPRRPRLPALRPLSPPPEIPPNKNGKPTMAEQLAMNPARILASLTPVLLAILLVIVANLPVSVTGGLVPAPLLALAPIYFWVIVRPGLMPPIAVLLIGLFEDLLSGGPPGIWATGFLAAYGLADRQRED